jgi:thiol-disulfide isomerase/thioredoxin/uncharacterized membrane protein YphA (DoxX/SURF4 family)
VDGALLCARLGLAAVFLGAGLAKFSNRQAARDAVAEFGIPHALSAPVAAGLPLAELTVGAALLPLASSRPGAVAALVLLAVFSAGIALNLRQGNAPECHCFGQLTHATVSWRSLARNTALAGVAALITFAGGGERVSAVGQALPPWQRVAALGLVAAFALLAVEWRLLLAAFADNGRALLALERVKLTASINAGMIPAGLRESLPAGTPAPRFSLPSLDGHRLTLDALLSRAKPILLIFTRDTCAPCKHLLPEIARWQAQYPDVTLAVIAAGGPARNAALAAGHRLKDVALQQDNEVANAYRARVTPCAVMIGSGGTIGSDVQAGAEHIRLLLAVALRRQRADDTPSPPETLRVIRHPR